MKNLLFKISILFVCFQLPVSAVTTFNASLRKGCDTLTVKFTYQTTLTVTSLKWTFGDGTESTEESPQHTYTRADNYTVSLEINGTELVEEAGFIKVGKTPDANFMYHDTLAFGLNNIVLNSVKQPDSPFIYSYSWSLSDGSTGNTSKFLHQFDTTGVYTAKLIVSDINGCADTVSKAVEVRTKLDVPNVFTPNDDNINDLLIIENNGETTYNIQIFSRAGIRVYETSAKVIVWDGRMFTGEKVRDGIYYYVIESADSKTKLKQTGFFYVYGNSRP